jgi:hypothetical protein
MLERTSRKLRLTTYLAIAGAIMLNNWLLEGWLNHAVSAAQTISELSAPVEPHAWVFRLFDCLAGLIILVATLQWPKELPDRWRRLCLWVGLLAISLGTIVDAMFPINCVLNDKGECVGSHSLSLFNEIHLFESTIISVLIFLAPLAIVLTIKGLAKQRALRTASYVLLLVMVWWGVDTSFRAIYNISGHGYMQRVFIVTLGVWLVVFAKTRYHQQRATHPTNLQ